MKHGRRRSGSKEAYWRKVIAEQATSGLSVRQFCREKHIHESSFYAWRREIGRRDRQTGSMPTETGPQFLPVRVTGGEDNRPDRPIEVISPDGWRVRVANGASAAHAAELLRHLQQLSQTRETRP